MSKIYLASFALVMIIGCQPNDGAIQNTIKKGMVKVAIFYPNNEGTTFDMNYYSTKHMPMAADLFGDELKAMAIDKGIAGRTSESAATYAAIGYFYFDNMDDYQNAMKENSEKLRADVPNYTNIQPVIQISEVVTFEME